VRKWVGPGDEAGTETRTAAAEKKLYGLVADDRPVE
jgi:hypothetical protein